MSRGVMSPWSPWNAVYGQWMSETNIVSCFIAFTFIKAFYLKKKGLEADLEAAEVKKGEKRKKKDIAVVGDRTRDLSLTRRTR